MVCYLWKSHYGLKHPPPPPPPNAWFKKFSATLLELGFVRCISVYCVFVKKTPRGRVILIVYVDDMVISDSDEDGIQKTKDCLKSRLHIKDQGQLQYFLGIEDLRNRQGIYPSRKKLQPDEGELLEDATRYRRLVGKLIY